MSMLLSAVAGQGGIKACGAPGTLSLSAGSDAYTEIDLSWSAPSDTGGGTVSGYHIQVSTNSGVSWSDQVADTGSTGTTYTASSLSSNTRYDFKVAAINEKGTGTYGNAPNLTTQAHTAASGGTVTTYGNYKSHAFTSSGTLTFSVGGSVDVLIVAGGGSGGTTGGGGAGGMQTATSTVTATGYTITIGGGGAGGYGTDGSDSSAMSTTSTGGGSISNDGGSGGANGNGTAGQGNDGGTSASFGNPWDGFNMAYGGGGGKGAVGGDGTAGGDQADGGDGGAGATNDYKTGSNITYAGGGGGGYYAGIGVSSPSGGAGGSGGGGTAPDDIGTGGNGTTNTGSGGGGGSGGTYVGGAGGSGIVVVRYLYQ